MDQFFIMVLGVTGVFLSQSSNLTHKRYACIFGLSAQPFWIYATFTAQQWGIFLLSFVYTGAWCLGFYNNWIKKSEGESDGK